MAPPPTKSHGGWGRWLLGVIADGGRPDSVLISGRRFRCLACGCVMLVVPCEVAPWRRYTLVTIALALALAGFGLGEAAGALRWRLAPGGTFDEGWPALGRWLRAITRGKLLRWIRGVSELSGRAFVERASAVLAEAWPLLTLTRSRLLHRHASRSPPRAAPQ